MSRKRSCPHCGSFNLGQWMTYRYKCRECDNVFLKKDAVLEEYVPKKPRPARPTRRVSDLQEKRNARRVGGRTTAGSGCVPSPKSKADVRSDDLRMECKSTKNKSFSLKLEDLQKLEGQALDDEMPVFAVEFRREVKHEYYIVDRGWFMQLLELYRRDQDD